jgi:hypothetical protein
MESRPTTESQAQLVDRNLVLSKTEKGITALQNRSRDFPQRLRTVLVLVDGHQDASTLIERFGALTDIQSALQELLERGLIGHADQSEGSVDRKY